jgi:hypothetical protein
MEQSNRAPDPSPEQIKASCAGIQKTWTKAERSKRAAWEADQRRVTIPQTRDPEGN